MNDERDVLAATNTLAAVAPEVVPLLAEWLPIAACPDGSPDA
jgi:hypothetical protein